MKRGTRVGEAYVAVTADGDGINEGIVDSVDKAGPDVDKAGKKHGKRYSERFAQTLDDLPKKVSKKLDEVLGLEAKKSGTKSGEVFSEEFAKTFRKKLARNISTELEDVIKRQLDLFEKAKAEVSGNRGGGISRGIGGGRDDDRLGDKFGHLFGAGSRSETLNILGRTIGGIINLTDKARRGAVSLFETFSKGFAQAGEDASIFQKIMGGAGAVGARGGGLLAGFAEAGPAAAVLVVALSAVASIMGALIGIATALSATIVSGLVGGLTVLGGALGVVTVAAGLLTVAFTSMTDAQRKLLGETFMPLKAVLTGFGQLIFSEFTKPLVDGQSALTIWSQNLQQAILPLAAFGREFGRAFANAGSILTAALSGPGFQAFATALGTYLPGIVVRLSAALGQFLNGLLGLFSAVMPYVSQFSSYLFNLAVRFSAFVNSAKGQNSIVDFTRRALESLKSLWGFIREFSGFLKDVLFNPSAQQAGNTIFDGLAKTFAHFRDIVKKAAANGDLQKWFDSAVQFGSALWAVMESLGGTFMALYNDGAITAISDALRILAGIIDILNPFIAAAADLLGALEPILGGLVGPVQDTANALGFLADKLTYLVPLLGAAKALSGGGDGSTAHGSLMGARLPKIYIPKKIDWGKLSGSGMGALNATSKDHGGNLTKEYKNPYKEFAESLIKEGPSIAAQIRNAMVKVNKQISDALRDLLAEKDPIGLRSGLLDQISSIKATAEESINTAQSALNSAARSLADASSKSAAKKALREVKQRQKDVKAALDNQKKINSVATLLQRHQNISPISLQGLLVNSKKQASEGLGFNKDIGNSTLAAYAKAREVVTTHLEAANTRLADAIAMRDQYRTSVADSAKAFGSILTSQAQVIGGIEQALTATDIQTNLQTRLDKIKKFQENLRVLSAQGLSASAYKQLVDAGVEGGSASVDALIAGGQGAVSQVNNLVAQIDKISNSLGAETSNRLYQAGVSAAKGLVDGLTSQAAQLDAAATRMGNAIANAVKRALGIHSPSTVMIDQMEYVGAGIVTGLDRQHRKVGVAASALASRVSISPTATVTAGQAGAEVSGNRHGQLLGDLHVHTPTEDPTAVAIEAVNELVGRIT